MRSAIFVIDSDLSGRVLLKTPNLWQSAKGTEAESQTFFEQEFLILLVLPYFDIVVKYVLEKTKSKMIKVCKAVFGYKVKFHFRAKEQGDFHPGFVKLPGTCYHFEEFD